jgi:hypothetical protein
MGNWASVNAFQMSDEDKASQEKYRKLYRYETWVPESVMPLSDTYIYYDNVKDFEGVGFVPLCIFIKEHNQYTNYTRTNPECYLNMETAESNPYDNMNLEDLVKVYWDYRDKEAYDKADEVLLYVKENFGRKYVEEE